MGRKSKLSPKQWENAAYRVTNGETARAVAADYGINETALRRGIAKLRELAERIAATDLTQRKNSADLAVLSVPQQRVVTTLAKRLVSISEHLASAAEYGAMTAHRLNSYAHKASDKIDDADPLSPESQPALAGVALLTKMANSSAEIGLNLLRANKEAVDDLNRAADDPPVPTQIVFQVASADA